MPDDLTIRPVTGSDTLRRGVRVLWRGIRDEPRMFALAVVGSAVYGAGTAGAGWLLGHLTQTVLAPAFSAGHVTGAQLAYVVGSLALVAVLTSLGVVVRRAAAGAVMFRLQARYRRAVTRQYLRLPLVLAPPPPRRPAALQRQRGRRGRSGRSSRRCRWRSASSSCSRRGCRDARRGPAARCRRPARPARGVRRERRLPAGHVPARRPARSSCGRASPRWPTRVSTGAVVVKTLGREAAETSRFGVAAARAARRQRRRRRQPGVLRSPPRGAAGARRRSPSS